MKLLRVISSMNPKGGGPSQGIRNSIPALQKLGVENDVVCLDNPSSAYLGSDVFTIYAIGPSKGPWAYAKTLIPWLKAHAVQYDAIIMHGLWEFSSFAVFKALKSQTNITTPYFVMPHGMLDPYFQKAPERRLKAIRNWFYWKIIENRVVRHASGVLFTCEEELLLARAAFSPYQPKKELNVGYGIQQPPRHNDTMTDVFKQHCPEIAAQPYILFLSRIHQKKGIDLLIEAYSKWLKTYKGDRPCDLVIAGPGLDTPYGQDMLRLVEKDDSIKNKVHFTGMLSGDAKWGAFYNANAFILPSHQENFGIAIVEALACSTPVLISNKVNIWREIEDESAGFVANDTPEGTLALLNKWSALSTKEQEAMRIQAKATYLKYYAIDPAAERLKQTLEAVVFQPQE